MNPHDEFLIDEASGIKVPSELYKAYQAGTRVVVEWIKANASLERGDRDVGLCFEDYLHFGYHDWRAQLKVWFKDQPELLKEWGIK